MRGVLDRAFQVGSGVIGFGRFNFRQCFKDIVTVVLAPFLAPDADDTAKGMTALSLLGSDISRSSLIKNYWQGERFMTYQNERDPSFSANCNVLTSLTYPVTNCGAYTTNIEKVTRFLCHAWLSKSDLTIDKWVRLNSIPLTFCF